MARLAWLQWIAAALTVGGLGYLALSLASAWRFLRRRPRATNSFRPPVSVLKPLRGADPDLEAALRSHLEQDYPAYEVIFGVESAADPAASTVRKLMAEYPQRAIRLVECPDELGSNRKVSSLVQMLPHAGDRLLMVSDSDVRLAPNALREVLAPFEDARVGMVTCLYRGVHGGGLWSRLEALGISSEFTPGVLTARELEGGVHFALGAAMAIRHDVLESVGGFGALVSHLADDYELGLRTHQAGYRVVLAGTVVDNHLPRYSLAGFWEHQLRWGRGIRDARPAGYAAMIFTFGLFWSALAVLFSQGASWAWSLFAVALALRVVLALVAGVGVLGDRQALRDLWLLPLRELAAFAVWLVSLFGHTVTWRGERFRLRKGRLFAIRPAERAR